MKKVLLGILMIIPILIVAAVLLITEVVLITPDISVESVRIVDEYQVDVEEVTIENFVADVTTYQLYSIISPRKASNKKVIWSIQDSTPFDPDWAGGNIAEIISDGLVKIVTSGTFRLVVTTDDGGYMDSCNFTIKSDVANKAYIVYDGEKLDEQNATLNIAIDEIKKLDACARPTDVDIEWIKWFSSDTSILMVDANGIIVPKKVGTAVVTMTLKSKDYVSNNGNVIKAPEISHKVTITITGGAFNMATYNLCGSANSIALSTLGASAIDFVDTKSSNCAINGETLEFSDISGKAVFEKNDTILVVNKYSKENKIVFENYDIISNGTIIIGKIPYTLNCVYAKDGTKAENITYASNNPSIASINENTGFITAKEEGEVKFIAQQQNGEIIEIYMNVAKPVIYFSLESDTKSGIANEYIYGNYSYNYDLTLVNTREINVVSPVNLVGNNEMFIWSIESDDNIATINQDAEITFIDFLENENKIVTVTAVAKNSAYSCDKVTRQYSFIVSQGVNVKSQDEVVKAANDRSFDIFVQKDIRFRTETNFGGIINLYKDMYGNGHLIDWKHIDSPDDVVTNNDIQGSRIIFARGSTDGNDDYIVIRNIKIRSSMLPEDGSIADDSFSSQCVRTHGRVKLQFCYLEYANKCLVVESNAEHCDDSIPDVIIEGCIMSNSSQQTVFCWSEQQYTYIVVKNCVFGQAASPSIGISTRDKYVENPKSILEIQGFCLIYNWKQTVNLDLIGGFGNDVPDAAVTLLKNLISSELEKEKYNQYFTIKNGIKYMHMGIMFAGLLDKATTEIIGDVAENGFSEFVFDFKASLGDQVYNAAKAALKGDLYPVRFYGYLGKYPAKIQYDETLVPSAQLYEKLRNGDPNFKSKYTE